MKEIKPWNSWTQITLAMGVVFVCAGIWWAASAGFNMSAISMFVLGVHSFIGAFMYYHWPQFADNASNLTQFINYSRLALIWLGFKVNDVFNAALQGNQIYSILIAVAVIAFGYMSISALLGFMKEIKKQ